MLHFISWPPSAFCVCTAKGSPCAKTFSIFFMILWAGRGWFVRLDGGKGRGKKIPREAFASWGNEVGKMGRILGKSAGKSGKALPLRQQLLQRQGRFDEELEWPFCRGAE